MPSTQETPPALSPTTFLQLSRRLRETLKKQTKQEASDQEYCIVCVSQIHETETGRVEVGEGECMCRACHLEEASVLFDKGLKTFIDSGIGSTTGDFFCPT